MCISCRTLLWNSSWLPPSYSWNQRKGWPSMSLSHDDWQELTTQHQYGRPIVAPTDRPKRIYINCFMYVYIYILYIMLYHYVHLIMLLYNMPKCLSLTHAPASHGFHVHRILSPPSSTWQFGPISRWETSGCPCLCGCLCKICLPAISRNMSLHATIHKK